MVFENLHWGSDNSHAREDSEGNLPRAFRLFCHYIRDALSTVYSLFDRQLTEFALLKVEIEPFGCALGFSIWNNVI